MSTLADKLKNVFSDVIELIESEYGLLDNLYQSDVFTQAECSYLRRQANAENHRLLELLIEHKSEEQRQKFIDNLEKTDQKHIANFIQAYDRKLCVTCTSLYCIEI